MRIQLKTFTDIVTTTALHKAGLHAVSRVHSIAAKFYCDKMTNRSLCPQDCGQCAAMLKQTVATINPAEARNVYAVFTFRMKNEFARKTEADARSHKATTPTNFLGEPAEANGFDQLLEALS